MSNAAGAYPGSAAAAAPHEPTVAEQLAISERRHRLLAEHANDVIWTMGLDGTITYVSPAVMAVRGITPEEAMAQTLDQVHPPASREISAGYFQRLGERLAAGLLPEPFHTELEYYHADGSTVWCDVQVLPHLDDSGHLIEILGVSRDISERRRHSQELRRAHEDAEAVGRALAATNRELAAANAELARLATTDALTGVANRRRFERDCERAITVAHRYLQPLSLLLFDIDHFKVVNDTRGHHVGDRALVAVAQRIQDRLRRADLLARWGGEEFAVLLPQTELAHAVVVADLLRELVAAAPRADDLELTISGGVAQLSIDDTMTSLMARADRGLFAAKSAGRNRIIATHDDHRLPRGPGSQIAH